VRSSRYDLEKLRPVMVARCSVPATVGSVQRTGESSPYTARETASSLVCHAIVAENGDSEIVRTLAIVGGGPVGAAGVGGAVVAGSVGVVLVSGASAPGKAWKVRSPT
jgi:hypothetical protein